MLKLLNGKENPIIDVTNFYIDELWSGLDELVFSISVKDPIYPAIGEEAVIEYRQPYLVKAIDQGKTSAKIKCQLDLDDWKADMRIDYSNHSNTAEGTISEILPPGWMVEDHAHDTTRRTIEKEAATPLEITQACRDTYGLVVRYDVAAKKVHLWDPDAFEPLGAFASRELNLTELNYKGKSTEFATRLYGYGKDGMSVADINGGKPYVEDFRYSDKIVSVYWKDERYTIPENLLADMKKRLKELAVPEISYSCKVIDLAKTNPELYGHQNFDLMQVVRLVDDIKQQSLDHQVVQRRTHPNFPERNLITLSTVTPKISNTMKVIREQVERNVDQMRLSLENAIDNATNWITGANGGYVVFRKDADGQPYEILIMDTPNIETAMNVWRWNQGGLGHSSHGYNGPYTAAITQDGSIVADFITAGTMLANIIKGGILTLGGKANGNGECIVLDADGKELARIDRNGITTSSIQITGGRINITTNNDDYSVIELRRNSEFVKHRMIIDPYRTEHYMELLQSGIKTMSILDAQGITVGHFTGSIENPLIASEPRPKAITPSGYQDLDAYTGSLRTADGKTASVSHGIIKSIT